jgi:hypothetical protein
MSMLTRGTQSPLYVVIFCAPEPASEQSENANTFKENCELLTMTEFCESMVKHQSKANERLVVLPLQVVLSKLSDISTLTGVEGHSVRVVEETTCPKKKKDA